MRKIIAGITIFTLISYAVIFMYVRETHATRFMKPEFYSLRFYSKNSWTQYAGDHCTLFKWESCRDRALYISYYPLLVIDKMITQRDFKIGMTIDNRINIDPKEHENAILPRLNPTPIYIKPKNGLTSRSTRRAPRRELVVPAGELQRYASKASKES